MKDCTLKDIDMNKDTPRFYINGRAVQDEALDGHTITEERITFSFLCDKMISDAYPLQEKSLHRLQRMQEAGRVVVVKYGTKTDVEHLSKRKVAGFEFYQDKRGANFCKVIMGAEVKD